MSNRTEQIKAEIVQLINLGMDSLMIKQLAQEIEREVECKHCHFPSFIISEYDHFCIFRVNRMSMRWLRIH